MYSGFVFNLSSPKIFSHEPLQNFEIEESINWEIAIVKKIKQFSAIIETQNKSEGVIRYQDNYDEEKGKEFDKFVKNNFNPWYEIGRAHV